MDTIIYLTLERKENAGGTKEAPPVFSIKEGAGSGKNAEEYRLLYVDVPEGMLKEPRLMNAVERERQEAENAAVNAVRNAAEAEWCDETYLSREGQPVRAGWFRRGTRSGSGEKGFIKRIGTLLKSEKTRPRRSAFEKASSENIASEYGETEYGKTEYGKPAYGKTVCSKSACGKSVCGKSENEKSAYGKNEYRESGYGITEDSDSEESMPKKVSAGEVAENRRKREMEQKALVRREALRLNLPWIRELAEYLVPYQLQSPVCRMVYDDSVEKWLKKYDICGWWEKNWPIAVFEEYHAPSLARRLMQHVHLSHFLVLGYAHCVPELLISQVRRMKSLRFILREMPEELDEFLEDFYEEYGLAASCRITEGATLRTERIPCAAPTVILDFSGEERLLTADVAKGSIWLDMDSLEEKRRRIEDRNTGIYYFSIKKEWKQEKTCIHNGGNAIKRTIRG